MDKNSYKEILKKLSSRFEKPEDSKYAILKYVIYIYAFSLPIILLLSYFNPCFLNLVIPAIAVLVPYKLFKEKSLKKIFVTGVIAVLLISFTFTAYQVEGIYFSQEPGELSSESFSNGTIDKVYGEQKTKFNFTVDLNTENIQTDNYTIFLNITWITTATPADGDFKSFKMIKLNNSEYYYLFNLKEHDMEDRLYSHHFSIRKNGTSGTVEWEETDSNFGPFTISRIDAYQVIMMQQLISTLLFLVLIIGIVWWRKRMATSREKSTEGLGEKEEDLEDYCPQCGALLEGKTTCPECGIDVDSYLDKKEKIKTKKAIEEVDQMKEEEEPLFEDESENEEKQKEE